jgi:hypothetical protein
MKKIILLIGVVAILLATMTLTTYAQTTNAAVTLTPEQLAKVDATVNQLIQQVPSKYQALVNTAIAIFGSIFVIARFIRGFMANPNGGLTGNVLRGIWGTIFHADVAKVEGSPADATKPNQTPRQAGLGVLFLLLLPALLLFSGCGTDHQYVDNESGTGMKLKAPVGFNGNNIFELDLTIGTFKHTALMQPVVTNRVYTPSLAVAATTRGILEANAMNSSTNPTVNTKGGDSYVINTGHADSGITNSADVITHTWQDEATP